jgi:hypothetical protein
MTIEVGKSGGGVFVPTSPPILAVSLGDIGPVTLVTITPPENERVRIVALYQNASVDIGIFVNGTQLGGTLDLAGRGIVAAGRFNVGTDCTVNDMVFGVDNVVRIDILELMTNGNITYGYQFGVVR